MFKVYNCFMFKNKKRKIIVVTGVALAILAGILLYVKNKGGSVQYTTAEVRKGDLVRTVSITGNLVADEDVDLNFEVPGRVNKILVKKGDTVLRGDTIALIDDKTFSLEVEQAKANLDRALAEAGLNEDTLREAHVAVENAEDVLDDTKNLNEQNIEAAREAVDNAQAYLDSANDYYDQIIAEYGSDSTNAKNAKLTLTTAENSLKSAREAKETTEKQGELSETNAKNNLNTAKARARTVASEFGAQSRNAVVQSAQKTYELALQNLSKSELKAPVTGQVTAINYDVGEVITSASASKPFAVLMSADLLLEADVPESDITEVNVGQSGVVSFESFDSGNEFDAQVIEIDPAATNIQDVINYKIKLALDLSADKKLKPGMSADIDILTKKIGNALIIPERAIKTENSQEIVEVLENGNTPRKVVVESGEAGDDGMIQIKSGLNEGDNVITFTKTK